MMFKTTTVLALVAALAPSALAAPGSDSNVEARQLPADCPRNDNACGWYLIDHNCISTDRNVAERFLVNLTDTPIGSVFTAIYHVNADGVPDRFVKQCGQASCSEKGLGRPETVCNA
ncbi:uncharacterized protein B0T15DRAFT_543520 [Chaetomium strumarium]|uniref:Uncharacterized protein n=1 Tax=Chaetomium strumarium TaxID=1170767 RepID=A0AAJ0LYT0_9PEZI|nr:hypothetical protein B0T15DRAFT_543520 [Chaetomium strumarium]